MRHLILLCCSVIVYSYSYEKNFSGEFQSGECATHGSIDQNMYEDVVDLINEKIILTKDLKINGIRQPYNTWGAIVRYIKSSRKAKEFLCPVCAKPYSKSPNAASCYLLHYDKYVFRCEHCAVVSNSFIKFKNHRKKCSFVRLSDSHSNTVQLQNNTYTCERCNMVFHEEHGYNEHYCNESPANNSQAMGTVDNNRYYHLTSLPLNQHDYGSYQPDQHLSWQDNNVSYDHIFDNYDDSVMHSKTPDYNVGPYDFIANQNANDLLPVLNNNNCLNASESLGNYSASSEFQEILFFDTQNASKHTDLALPPDNASLPSPLKSHYKIVCEGFAFDTNKSVVENVEILKSLIQNRTNNKVYSCCDMQAGSWDNFCAHIRKKHRLICPVCGKHCGSVAESYDHLAWHNYPQIFSMNSVAGNELVEYDSRELLFTQFKQYLLHLKKIEGSM